MKIYEAQLGGIPRFELLIQAESLPDAAKKAERIRKERYDLSELVSVRKIGELEP